MRVYLIVSIALLSGCAQQASVKSVAVDPEFEWVKNETSGSIAIGDTAIAIAECPEGKEPVSGGLVQSANDDKFRLLTSYPLNHMWRVQLRNIANNAAQSDVTVWVLCAKGVPIAPL